MSKQNKRTVNIFIRTTPEQKKIISEKANSVGLSVSDYIRFVALTYKTKKTKND